MRLIFIRHGDPDYKHDALTAKGEKEAASLHCRVDKWLKTDDSRAVDKGDGCGCSSADSVSPFTPDTYDFYTSPLGRARRTAEVALRGTGRKAEELSWLQEFFYPVEDPLTGDKRIAWDWMPSWFACKEQAALKDADKWDGTSIMQSGNIAHYYDEVCNGLDAVLQRYGYARYETLPGIYHTDGTHSQGYLLNKSTDTYKSWHDGRTAVFFCHLGVMFAAMSHLLAMSPVTLWQSFFVAPTSLTILGSEERECGLAAFRVQTLGDTQHLHDAGAVPSASGYFTDVFTL